MLLIAETTLTMAGPISASAAPPALGAAEVVSLVRVLEKSKSVAEKIRAARRLAALGERAHPASLTILDALEHAEGDYWDALRDARHAIGPRICPYLIVRLKDRDAKKRLRAARACAEGQFGKRTILVNALIPLAFADPSEKIRLQAIRALGTADIDTAVLPLTQLLRNKRDSIVIRLSALGQFGNLGPQAHWANPTVVAFLGDETLGPEAVWPLIYIASSDEGETRLAAILSPLVCDQAAKMLARRYALDVIGKTYRRSAALRTALLCCLRDRRDSIREEAADAIRMIGGRRLYDARFLPELRRGLQDKSHRVRLRCAVAFIEQKGETKVGVAVLTKELRSSARDDRVRALTMLGNLPSSAAKTAIPAILKCLTDSDKLVRSVAIRTLVIIGNNDGMVLPKLREVADKDTSTEVRKAAAEALRHLGWRPD